MPTPNRAYLGDVVVNNKTRRVVIDCKYLHPVEDFVSKELIHVEDIDYLNYSEIYGDYFQDLLLKSHPTVLDAGDGDQCQIMAAVLREDTRFRITILI
jgi:hypothetical protein